MAQKVSISHITRMMSDYQRQVEGKANFEDIEQLMTKYVLTKDLNFFMGQKAGVDEVKRLTSISVTHHDLNTELSKLTAAFEHLD